VLFAGNLAAVPVAIDGDLLGHLPLLDPEIALSRKVRGQVRWGNIILPGGPLALAIDLGFGDVIVFVAVVPHHVFKQLGRLLFGKRRDRLGIV
jgi:hypothetical protein